MTLEEREKMLIESITNGEPEEDLTYEALTTKEPKNNYFSDELLEMFGNIGSDATNPYVTSKAEAEKRFSAIDSIEDSQTLTAYYKAYAENIKRDIQNQDEFGYYRDLHVLDSIEDKLRKGNFWKDEYYSWRTGLKGFEVDVGSAVTEAGVKAVNEGFNVTLDFARLNNIASREPGSGYDLKDYNIKVPDSYDNPADRVEYAKRKGYQFDENGMYKMSYSEDVKKLEDLHAKYPNDGNITELYNIVMAQGNKDSSKVKELVDYANNLINTEAYNNTAWANVTKDEKEERELYQTRRGIADYGLAGNIALGATDTLSYMAIPIATGVGVASALGGGATAGTIGSETSKILMSLGKMGGEFDRALKEGHSYNDSGLYSVWSGANEYIWESIGGDFFTKKLYGATTLTPLGKAVNSFIEGTGIKQKAVKAGMKWIGEVAAEGLEEVLTDLSDNVAKSTVLKEKGAWEECGKQLWESFTGSIIPTIILGGLGQARTINYVNEQLANFKSEIEKAPGFTVEQKAEMIRGAEKAASDARIGLTENYDEIYNDLANKLAENEAKEQVIQSYEQNLRDSGEFTDEQINNAINQVRNTTGMTKDNVGKTAQQILDETTNVKVEYDNKDIIKKDLDDIKKGDKNFIYIKPVTNINKELYNIREAIGNALDTEIVYIKANKKGKILHGVTYPGKSGILYVTVGQNLKDTIAATFHEFGHQLKLQKPELYEAFKDRYKQAFPNADEDTMIERFSDKVGSVMAKAENVKGYDNKTQSLISVFKDYFSNKYFGTERNNEKLSAYNLEGTPYTENRENIVDETFDKMVEDAIFGKKKSQNSTKKTTKSSQNSTQNTQKSAQKTSQNADKSKKVDTKAEKNTLKSKAKSTEKKKEEAKPTKKEPLHKLTANSKYLKNKVVSNLVKEAQKAKQTDWEGIIVDTIMELEDEEADELVKLFNVDEDNFEIDLYKKLQQFLKKELSKSNNGAKFSEDNIEDSDGKTLTKDQQKFFKDSKVRDEDGNLLVVYHGSMADFNAFDKEKISSGADDGGEGYLGSGFYFTNDIDYSKGIVEHLNKMKNGTLPRPTRIQNFIDRYETRYNEIQEEMDALLKKNGLDPNSDRNSLLAINLRRKYDQKLVAEYEKLFKKGVEINKKKEKLYEKYPLKPASNEGVVKSYYLNLKNPLRLDLYEKASDDIRDMFWNLRKNLSEEEFEKQYDKEEQKIKQKYGFTDESYDIAEEFFDRLGDDYWGFGDPSEYGYDGVIAETSKDVFEFVAYEPNQIKLTTNEHPSENVDIRYSEEDVGGKNGEEKKENSRRNTAGVEEGSKAYEDERYKNSRLGDKGVPNRLLPKGDSGYNRDVDNKGRRLALGQTKFFGNAYRNKKGNLERVYIDTRTSLEEPFYIYERKKHASMGRGFGYQNVIFGTTHRSMARSYSGFKNRDVKVITKDLGEKVKFYPEQYLEFVTYYNLQNPAVFDFKGHNFGYAGGYLDPSITDEKERKTAYALKDVWYFARELRKGAYANDQFLMSFDFNPLDLRFSDVKEALEDDPNAFKKYKNSLRYLIQTKSIDLAEIKKMNYEEREEFFFNKITEDLLPLFLSTDDLVRKIIENNYDLLDTSNFDDFKELYKSDSELWTSLAFSLNNSYIEVTEDAFSSKDEETNLNNFYKEVIKELNENEKTRPLADILTKSKGKYGDVLNLSIKFLFTQIEDYFEDDDVVDVSGRIEADLFALAEDYWKSYFLFDLSQKDILAIGGYDGLVFTHVVDYGGDGFRLNPGDDYVAFDSNQVKLIDNLNPTESKEFRYSEDDVEGYFDNKIKLEKKESDIEHIDNLLTRLSKFVIQKVANKEAGVMYFDDFAKKNLAKKDADLLEVLSIFDSFKRTQDSGHVLYQIANGIRDLETDEKLSKGFSEIIENLTPSKEEAKAMGLSVDEARARRVKQWEKLGISQRAVEYAKRGLESGIDLKKAKEYIEKYKDDKKLHQALKDFRQIGNSILDLGVKEHVWSQELVDTIKENNLFYFPMQRAIEDTDTYFDSNSTGSVKPGLKKVKGSERDILDPIVSAIGNYAAMLHTIDMNRMYTQMEEIGNILKEQGIENPFFKNVKPSLKNLGRVSLEVFKGRLNKQFRKLGYDELVNGLNYDEMYNIFVPTDSNNKNRILSYFVDGKRKYIQFSNNDLGKAMYDVLANVGPKKSHEFLEVVKMFNQTLMYGATILNTEFAVSNIAADSGIAFLSSDNLWRLPFISTMFDAAKLLSGRIGGKVGNKSMQEMHNLYEKFLRSGAMSGARLKNNFQNIFDEMLEDSTGFSKKQLYGKDVLKGKDRFRSAKKKIGDILGFASQFSEEIGRFGMWLEKYEMCKKQGMKEGDAIRVAGAYARKGTQDFSIKGEIMEEFNKFVPYSAASIGGLYKIGRGFKENPVRLSIRLGFLMALGLLVHSMMDDDDRKYYEEMNKTRKFANYVIPNGTDEPFIVKKPQGVPRAFINFAEYMYDVANGYIPEEKVKDKFYEWLGLSLGDTLPVTNATDAIPSFLQPFIENRINRDFYYNSPIVPEYMENLDPENQYDEYTSEFSKALGKIFHWSPIQIDNVIKSNLAGLGKQILDWSDAIVRETSGNELPEKRNSEQYILSRIYGNTLRSPESVSEIYDRFGKLKNQKAEGRMTADEQREYDNLSQAISVLGDLNKQIKATRVDSKLSAKQKKDKIESLQEERTDTARYYTGKDLINPKNKEKIELREYYPSKDTYTYTVNKNKKVELDFSSEKVKIEYAKKLQEAWKKDLEELKKSKEYQKATALEKIELEKDQKSKTRTKITNDMKEIIYNRTK